MRFLLLLLLTITIGCGSDETAQQSATSSSDSPQQPKADSTKEKPAPSDDTLTDDQVAALLAQHLGQWKGTAVFKGPDGEVAPEIPLINTCYWLEEGKLIEMRVTEKHQQRDHQLIFTEWYDREQQRFLVTRRLVSEPPTTKPGAYETYNYANHTFHGTVIEGLPPGTSWTWTSQWINQDKIMTTSQLHKDGKLQSTRIDTLERVKPARETP